jgi:hypothetical protein
MSDIWKYELNPIVDSIRIYDIYVSTAPLLYEYLDQSET